MNYRHEGLVLSEFFILAAIIVIFAVIAIPHYMTAQTNATVAETLRGMHEVELGLDKYFVDNAMYPPCVGDNNLPHPVFFQRLKALTTPFAYLDTIPLDPFLIGMDQKEFLQFSQSIIGDYAYLSMGAIEDVSIPFFYSEDFTVIMPYREFISPMWWPGTGWISSDQDNVVWIQASVGPDKLYNYCSGAWFAPCISYLHRWQSVPYDPTNGTISYGDIFKYGGEDMGNLNYK